MRKASYDTYDQAKCSERFRKMARFNVWQTPTLTLRQRLDLIGLDKLATDPQLRHVPGDLRKTWIDPRQEAREASPATLEHFKQDYAHHQKLVGLMVRSGVAILAGTDTGDAFVLPGFALHDELELLVDAGLSPLQALQAATIQPARYLSVDNSFGSINRGKMADLVLLDADPLIDIRNTRRIARVIVDGIPYLPRQLLTPK
ncbi:MAG: amidohydrolase family protein [Bryobacteraceae bacterium]